MLKCIIFSLILSTITFGAAIKLGEDEIKLSIFNALVFLITTFFISLIYAFLGGLIFLHIPEQSILPVSAFFIITAGFLVIKKSIFYSPTKQYKLKFLNTLNFLYNTSKELTKKEIFTIAIILSLNNILPIMSFSFNIKNIFYIPFFTSIFQTSLLVCGIDTGKKIKNIYTENYEKWILIFGILLVLIGITNLL